MHLEKRKKFAKKRSLTFSFYDHLITAQHITDKELADQAEQYKEIDFSFYKPFF